MGKVGAETCSVCQENSSKYRCPGCGAPYCSLACNKLHKSGTGGNPSCSGKRPLSAKEAQGAGEASPAKRSNVGSEGGSSAGGDAAVQEVEAAVCVRTGRDQWRGGREDREEEEWQMSSDQRERMSGCKWLKAALRDPKLQGLLTEIDQARDREKALAFHRTSTQFGEFMDKLLLEIGEYRKGGVDEPELVTADP